MNPTRNLMEITNKLLYKQVVNESTVTGKDTVNKPEGTGEPKQEKVSKESPKVEDKENTEEVKPTVIKFVCKCNKDGVLNKPTETGMPSMQSPKVESSFEAIYNKYMKELNEESKTAVLYNDAGNIAVVDKSWIESHGGTPRGDDPDRDGESAMKEVKLPKPGKYSISLTVGMQEVEDEQDEQDEDYRHSERSGDVEKKSATFTSESGIVYVGDLCYHFTGKGDAWDKVIKETDYLRKDSPENGLLVVDSPYGDGTFEVTFSYIPVI